MADVELLPCPFCGSGKTEIRENGRPWLGMRYGDPSSVSVRHWCEPIEGQPSRMIERVGRDRATAITAWNTRATDANLAALQAEVEALRAEVERVTCELMDATARADKLAEALREARDAIEDWAGYASDYFREKHDLAGDLAKIDALLRDQEEGQWSTD